MGWTPHILWSDVQTRVGILHKILRCLRSNGGGDTAHSNINIWSDGQTRVGTTHIILKCLRSRGEGGGTPHIPFEDIWSDVQTKVGTPHQVGAARLRSRVGE